MFATSTLVAAGIAATAAGAVTQTVGAMGAANAQKDITRGEMEAEKVRKQAMEFKAHRELLDITRKQDIASALGLVRATNQGAQQGSGFLGGEMQIASQGNYQRTGIFGALESGEDLFKVNQQIGEAKIDLAGWQGISATGQGLGTLGKGLLDSAPAWGKLSQGFKNPYTFTGYSGVNGLY